MYDKSELEGKLLNELRDIAKQFNIRKSETMKKQDLVYIILDHQAANPTPDILEAEKKARVFPQKGPRQRIPLDKIKDVRKTDLKTKVDVPPVLASATKEPEIKEPDAKPEMPAVPKDIAAVADIPKEVVKPAEPGVLPRRPYESSRPYNRDFNKSDDDTPSEKSFERPASSNVPAWEMQEFHERRRRGRRPQDRDDDYIDELAGLWRAKG
jgi:transcription termination factor Rho